VVSRVARPEESGQVVGQASVQAERVAVQEEAGNIRQMQRTPGIVCPPPGLACVRDLPVCTPLAAIGTATSFDGVQSVTIEDGGRRKEAGHAELRKHDPSPRSVPAIFFLKCSTTAMWTNGKEEEREDAWKRLMQAKENNAPRPKFQPLWEELDEDEDDEDSSEEFTLCLLAWRGTNVVVIRIFNAARTRLSLLLHPSHFSIGKEATRAGSAYLDNFVR
ncbi:unnamed protein product, partial [Symbiodinium microadriaticum]